MWLGAPPNARPLLWLRGLAAVTFAPPRPRMACPDCDTLATGEDTCWNCDGPMVPASAYLAPTSSPFVNPMLALINGGTPHE